MTQRKKASRAYWDAYQHLVKTCDLMEKAKELTYESDWEEKQIYACYYDAMRKIASASKDLNDIIDTILNKEESMKIK